MIKGSALPLEKGLNKIDTATDIKVSVAHCDLDGSLTVTWLDGSTSTEEFVAGEDRDMRSTSKVTIIDGTFSFSKSMLVN